MRIKGLGVVLCALLLAGCGSPESSIKDSCIRNGGLTGAKKKLEAGVVEKQCGCYAEQLKKTLKPDQLALVADMMKLPEKERKQAGRELPTQTAAAVMGAAKSCASMH